MISPRCEPPPEHQDKRWHWLMVRSDEPPTPCEWRVGNWVHGGNHYATTRYAELGITYLYPVLYPTEVEALRERSVEPMPNGWLYVSIDPDCGDGWRVEAVEHDPPEYKGSGCVIGIGPTINAACKAAIAQIGNGK